jgi:hypothetical protein
MNIEEMSLDEVKFELKRARFWVEDSPIKDSLLLIERMEKRKLEVIREKLC